MNQQEQPVVIQTSDLSKDFGNGKGIFQLDLAIRKGEAFGFIGTNGSGKTTTIRTLMGFLKPTHGSSSINHLDSWSKSPDIMSSVSYVPGEISFPPLSTGTAFLKSQAEYLHLHDFSMMNTLIARLQLDTSASLKHMSKGMKQKTAITAALMADRDILILDEPTTGLDPLMRETFIHLLQELKAQGNTIFMSTQIFSEAEDLCDRVAFIKDGKILETVDMYALRHPAKRGYVVTFADEDSASAFVQEAETYNWLCTLLEGQVQVSLAASEAGKLLHSLQKKPVKRIQEKKKSLEDLFLEAYEKEEIGHGS